MDLGHFVFRLTANNLWRYTTGPDAQNTHSVILASINGPTSDNGNTRELKLEFFASELRLRGDEPVVQPHRNERGDVFCWNGEVCGLSSAFS